MKSVGRVPGCGGVVIVSVTGRGIKCLNMEILEEITKKCDQSELHLQGSRCLHWAGRLCPPCRRWSWAGQRTISIQLERGLISPGIVPVLLLVIVVRIGGTQSLHLGAALSFILQIADQIVSSNFYRLQRLPPHGQLGAKDGGFCRE